MGSFRGFATMAPGAVIAMRILIFLAFKSLVSSRLALVLLVASVMAGVGFQIPNKANIDGYSAELLRTGVSRNLGHVVISPRGESTIKDVAALEKKLRGLSFVRGLTTRVLHPGVAFKGEEHRAVRVVGLVSKNEERLRRFCSEMKAGRCMEPDSLQAVAGAYLADKMGLKVGDRIRLVLPYQDLDEVKYARAKYTISGIKAGGGGFQADKDLFISLKTIVEQLGYHDEATQLSIFVDDPERAAGRAAALSRTVKQARVETWWKANAFVANAIEGNRTIASISMIMVILAVGIPVLALLYIHVLHERRQIAILSTMGFGRSALFTIYLLKAMFVGIVGVGLGIGLGVGLCAYFDHNPLFSHGGFVVRPDLTATAVAIPALVTFVVTVLAGIAPAVRASVSNPALELRED